jgi:hypothetical protein
MAIPRLSHTTTEGVESRDGEQTQASPERLFASDAVGTKTNEFNCHHGSHFRRPKAML